MKNLCATVRLYAPIAAAVLTGFTGGELVYRAIHPNTQSVTIQHSQDYDTWLNEIVHPPTRTRTLRTVKNMEKQNNDKRI